MDESKYIKFEDAGRSVSGKTGRWYVVNKRSGDRLGLISWYGPWRCYVLEPEPDCVFNASCMWDIIRFIGAQ